MDRCVVDINSLVCCLAALGDHEGVVDVNNINLSMINPLISAWRRKYTPSKVRVKLLIDSQTSTVTPLKFGNG